MLLNKTTAVVSSMWRSVTESHKETMTAHFKYMVLDPKTLEILKKAYSSDSVEKDKARAELFRHLWADYEYIKKEFKVLQLHFHTPDCKSFLRFHAPFKYGDDLKTTRPAVCFVNQEKRPLFVFEIGKLATGFRYIFPIIDNDGNHFGSVEISRSFESLRKTLSEVDPSSEYILLLKEKIVYSRVVENFRKYYTPVPNISGWLIEHPLGEPVFEVKPLSPNFKQVFENLGKDRDFKELLDSEKDGTIALAYNGEYYKITLIKIREHGSAEPSATLLSLSLSQDIKILKSDMKRSQFLYTIVMIFFSALFSAFLRQVSYIQQTQEKLDTITSSMGSGLLVIDKNGAITMVNNTACELLGYRKEDLIGQIAHYTIHHHPSPMEECPLYNAIREGRDYINDDKFRCKDGSILDVHVICKPLGKTDSVSGGVIVFHDITERKRMERELYRIAITDPLTGLYNRRYQMEKLQHAKNMADRYDTPFSVLIIDIDNFKRINDTCGHEVGDEVLRKLASIIRENLRSTDIPARWGGEEFLVLLNNTELQNAVITAERIRIEVEGYEGQELPPFTISVGVAQYEKGEDLKDLISRADTALYRAKSQGKNRVESVS